MKDNILLVDSNRGIYAWHYLATEYPDIYVRGDKVISKLDNWLINNSDIMEGETIETVFNPDNENWMENVDYLTGGSYVLCLIDDDSQSVDIEQSEHGDIWAAYQSVYDYS